MEIQWVHLELIEETRAAIEARLRKLLHGHDDLGDVKISGQSTQHHRHGVRSVRISCRARGHELVAAREREELGLALNEVLDDFERQVNELRAQRRDKRTEAAQT